MTFTVLVAIVEQVPCFAFAAVLVACSTGCEEHGNSRSEGVVAESEGRNPTIPLKPVSLADLKRILQGRDFDAAIVAFNRVKSMRYQGEVLPFVVDLWYGRTGADVGMDAAFLNHPRIRIEIADVLMQASNNGYPTVSRKELDEFARAMSKSSDRDVAMVAVGVVGHANDPSDVPLLKEVALEEEEVVFNSAAIALSFHCFVEQKDVDNILAKLKSRENREYLERIWAQSRQSKQVMCQKFKRVQ